jgi:transcriptional regulator with XRE-family HTH domain
MSGHAVDAEERADYTEEDLRLFGGRVAEQRRTRGWTQREASQRLGLQASRLSRIERGTVWPRLEELVGMRRLYVLGLDEMVFGPGRDGGREEESLLRQICEMAAPEDREALIRLLRATLAGFRSVSKHRGSEPG